MRVVKIYLIILISIFFSSCSAIMNDIVRENEEKELISEIYYLNSEKKIYLFSDKGTYKFEVEKKLHEVFDEFQNLDPLIKYREISDLRSFINEKIIKQKLNYP